MAGRPAALEDLEVPFADGRRGAGRRRRARLEPTAETFQPQARSRTPVHSWTPKWERLLTAQGETPSDFTEFDRTVRSMLNRISSENAYRILPLEPSLRGGEPEVGGDCPQWWATRFAALMLNSYLEVIHTNRFARGLAVRSADNVLPEYLDAVSPLLAQSPRLVTALMAWFAAQLEWHSLCWPTARLMLLAAREQRDRDTLPVHSLGRLPAEVLQGRILSFLKPPSLPAVASLKSNSASCISSCVLKVPGADVIMGPTPFPERGINEGREDKKDIVAVLVHLIMFSPLAIWPQLSTFGFSLAEDSLGNIDGYEQAQVQIYLAASIITALAQRIEAKVRTSSVDALHRLSLEELGPLGRLNTLLCNARDEQCKSADGSLSVFVDCRIQVAIEHVHRVQELSKRQFDSPIAVVPDVA